MYRKISRKEKLYYKCSIFPFQHRYMCSTFGSHRLKNICFIIATKFIGLVLKNPVKINFPNQIFYSPQITIFVGLNIKIIFNIALKHLLDVVIKIYLIRR